MTDVENACYELAADAYELRGKAERYRACAATHRRYGDLTLAARSERIARLLDEQADTVGM